MSRKLKWTERESGNVWMSWLRQANGIWSYAITYSGGRYYLYDIQGMWGCYPSLEKAQDEAENIEEEIN